MRYVMKSGVLYREPSCALAKLKGVFVGPEKRVYLNDGSLVLKTAIRQLDVPAAKKADVRSYAYVMLDAADTQIAVARPDYADGDDPAIVGWPICRMPRVDRAAVEIYGKKYILIMQNSQNYTLKDTAGYIVVQVMHRGLTGGWNLDVDETFTPEILCGLFAFCRYIEQENELQIV